MMETTAVPDPMMLPPIDFLNIRSHLGSQQIAFEELCVQIFRSEFESHGEFHRVEGAGGDGGVEAFIVLDDKTEIGLQTKWFKSLGPAQWRQIDKSVKTALTKHPKISRYQIAIPLNRTPHQLKLWRDRKRKWQKHTKRRVKFIWLGKSELSDFLSRPPHQQLLLYWFGLPQFTDDWMDSVIKTAIRNLDRRYSPKQHTDTETGKLIETFAWSPTFIESMKSAFVELAKSWGKYSEDLCRTVFNRSIRKRRDSLISHVDRLMRSELPAFGQRTISDAIADADGAIGIWQRLHSEIHALDASAKKRTVQKTNGPPPRNFEYLLIVSDRFGEKIDRWRGLLSRSALADKHRVLVLGEAGTGKSHLIASVLDHARKRQQPALLLLGEQFTAADEPWGQALRVMGWNASVESLLSAINQAGALAGSPALVCIDALNESDHRGLWANHLNAFAAKIEKFTFVRLIVSCRSDFKDITLPSQLAAGHDGSWAIATHYGFGEELFEAVGNYFEGYRIKSSHFPPLIEEFRNPLFLRLFCEAFEGQSLPAGPLTLELVMTARIEKLTRQLQRDIDCSPEDVKSAIRAVAKLISANQGKAVDKELVRSAVNSYSPQKTHSHSLYTHFRSNGIIVELTGPWGDSTAAVKARFAFERFSDYFVASELLAGIRTARQLRSAWKKGGSLAKMLEPGEYWQNRGLFAALAILLPERYRTEFVDLIEKADLRRRILPDFLASLPWRSAASFTERSREVLRESQRCGLDHFIQAILRVATIPEHPYNAEYLHTRLMQMPLSHREIVWTIPITNLSQDESAVPSMIVTWATRVPRDLISDDQALLVARVLCWFTSSNRRLFRKEASLAAIRILEGRAKVASRVVYEFAKANDPYVNERVYAVACGVALRESDDSALKDLAAVVFEQVFAGRLTAPNILGRDFAQVVLESAARRGCLPPGVSTKRFRPPFRSKWPKIWSERRIDRLAKNQGWRKIFFSVRPEAMMPYGDFGRYVMEAMVHRFTNIPKSQPYPEDIGRNEFDGRIARRWVIQRVKELGWTPKLFENYERNLGYVGRHVDDEVKIERISKKYQWIALFELLGYLSDHFYLRPQWGQNSQQKQFLGAWQIMARDFDPSMPITAMHDDESEDEGVSTRVQSAHSAISDSYPDPFADIALCLKRADWVVARPVEFKPLIHYAQAGGSTSGDWLTINGFWNWQEPEFQAHRTGVDGRLEMWVHIRSWLVKKADFRNFMARIRNTHFWGHGCLGVSLGDGWLGEYPWGAVFSEAKDRCLQPDEWIEDVHIEHIQTACRWDERPGFKVPSPQVCDLMALRWSGCGPRFCNDQNEVVAIQAGITGASEDGPAIVQRNALRTALEKTGLHIVWGLVGERECWDHSSMGSPKCIGGKVSQFSGVYTLGREGIEGGLTRHVIEQVPPDLGSSSTHKRRRRTGREWQRRLEKPA